MSCMHALPSFLVRWYVLLCIFLMGSWYFFSDLPTTYPVALLEVQIVLICPPHQPVAQKSHCKARSITVWLYIAVVDVDARLSDACVVCMLSEEKYSVHTSSEGQILFLLFLACIFAVAGYTGISYAGGGVKHQAIQRCRGVFWSFCNQCPL